MNHLAACLVLSAGLLAACRGPAPSRFPIRPTNYVPVAVHVPPSPEENRSSPPKATSQPKSAKPAAGSKKAPKPTTTPKPKLAQPKPKPAETKPSAPAEQPLKIDEEVLLE